MNFILIGDGQIAKYHRKAIEHVGGKLSYICDPEYGEFNLWKGVQVAKYNELPELAGKLWDTDRKIYVVIASPSHLHREQIRFVLNNFPSDTQIICEKPAFLPWEPIVDSDKVNICLQLRYIPNLPKEAVLVKMVYVRDEAYFSSWKGDPQKTGGLFYNLFIHGIDLAHRLKADFVGSVRKEGFQDRYIGLKWSWPKDVWYDDDRFIAENDKVDILKINIQSCYNAMYEDIITGGGIKPRDLFYLDWILKRNSEIFGYGKNGLNRTIKIGHELL